MPRNTTRSEPGRHELSASDRKGSLFVQPVGKAMTVLSAVHHADCPLSLSELVIRSGVDRSAAR